MLKLLGSIPYKVNIAFSGGIDSVVVASFLSKSNRQIRLLYFNHGTKHGAEAEQFVKDFAKSKKLSLEIGNFDLSMVDKNKSQEENWRDSRYSFLESFSEPIITCHHLDDQVETWLFSAMHNFPKLIPYRRNSIIRPFLLCTKKQIENYAKQNCLNWIQDESNYDVKYSRNRIRNNILPEVLKINPGLHKVIARKVVEEYNVQEK